MGSQSKITVPEFVKRNAKNFSGVSVETQDHLDKLIGECKTGHWIASIRNIQKKSQIVIISKHEPGKVVVGEIASVTLSKSFPGRCVIGISNAVIQKWETGKNQKLHFSRNPVRYY